MKKIIIVFILLCFTWGAFAEVHEIITNPNLTFQDVLPAWSKNSFKRDSGPPAKDLVVDCKGNTDCEVILNVKNYQQLKELYETINSRSLQLPRATSFYIGRCFSNLPMDNPKKPGLGAMYFSINNLSTQIFLFTNRLAGSTEYPADYADGLKSNESANFKRFLLAYGEVPFDYEFKDDSNGKETILGETQGGVSIIGKIKQISNEIFLVKVSSKDDDQFSNSIKKDSYCKIMKKNF